MKRHCLQTIGLLTVLGTLLVGVPYSAWAEENNADSDVIEMKKAMSADIDSLKDAAPGVDYFEDEIIILCNSQDEAQAEADKFYEEYGVRLYVKDYSFGVAVLGIENISENTVEDIVIASADLDNDLMPAYPNYYEELCSLDDKYINTDNEHYTDPFTKKNSVQYQYYHELIDSKYVWDALEKDVLVTSEGKSMKDELENTIVAVIDTGINISGMDFHEADADGNRSGSTAPVYVGGHCFVPSLAADNVDDENGHGSNVAGIIADTANDLNGRGVASGVKIMPLRVFGASGTTSSAYSIRAVNYAAESRILYNSGVDAGDVIVVNGDSIPSYNVKVINMSLGGFTASSSYLPPIKKAKEAGIAIFAAAGNYSTEARFYPAAYDGVVSVASVNSDYKKSNFSDYGDTVEIAAPGGENSYDAKYESNSYTRTETIYASGKTNPEAYYGTRGTSQATPVVSAVAALAMTKYPDKTVDEIVTLLKDTSTPVYSEGIGVGCVNAAAAIGIDAEPKAPEVFIMHAVNEEDPSDGTEGILAVEKNEMNRMNGIHFSANGDTVIYYTINGNDPDPVNMEETGTLIYEGSEDNPESWVLYGYDGDKKSITIKAKTHLYGKLSDTYTCEALYGLNRVEKISVYAKSGILLSANSAKVSVGNSITLGTVTYPANADNTDVVWESSDTSSVTVTDKGVVKVIAAKGDYESPLPVCITANAKDGYGAKCDFYIYAVPSVSNIEIDIPGSGVNMYNADTIFLEKYGEEYDMSLASEVVKVWPDNALQKVIYSSSNDKIVSVSSDGIVTAKGPGLATVTVMAADGSGCKDAQKFKVANPIYGLSITDSNKSALAGHLIAGGKLVPKVTFNNGESVPDNRTLVWSFTESSYNNYASINEKTGVVTAKTNAYVKDFYAIRIEAYSPVYGKSAQYLFYIHPRVTALNNKTGLDENGAYVKQITRGSTEYIKNIIEISPMSGTYDGFSVTSSDTQVAAIIDGGFNSARIKALNEGVCYIDVRALDGSNASCRIKLTVADNHSFSSGKIGVVFKNDDNIFYPGKRLPIDYDTNFGVEITSVEWSLPSNEKYMEVKNGYVVSKNDAEELTEYKEELLTVKGIKVVSPSSTQTATGSSIIRLFPARTEEVKVESVISEQGENLIEGNKVSMVGIGCKAAIGACSLPYNSCQDSYRYVSSNPLVVKVDENGVLTSVKSGSAKITVYAGDNGGAKTVFNVSVSEIKAVSVIAPIKEMHLSTVEIGGMKACGELSSEDIMVLPAKAQQKVECTSSNKSVATVEIKNKNHSNEPDVYVIRAVGKGKANIKITAADGSRKNTIIKVTVDVPVSEINITSNTSSFVLKPGKSLGLKAKTNANASGKGVAWEFTDASMEEYASIDKKSGTVKAYANPDEETEHIIKVRARALDYGGYVSDPMNIVISPSVVKMKNIQVKSKTNIYDLGYGSSLAMMATTTVDATNRKIVWSISDSDIASISSTGILKARGPVDEKKTVTVTAAALDGSGVMGSCKVYLYPKMDKIIISGGNEIFAGEQTVINIEGLNAAGESLGSGAPRQKFSVMYTTGAGKAYLNNSDGTSVTVKGIKRGTVTITVTALDGSNKTAKYKILIK